MALLLWVVAAAASAQDTRQPVPVSAKQGPVLYKLKTDYKAEYLKREAADQLALANTFLKEAGKSESEADPVRRYVLLREARELAINSGNLTVTFNVIDEMARDFSVDANELKVTAMAGAVGRSKLPPLAMMDQYLTIAEQAITDGDVQMAYQASRLSTKIARESKDSTAQTRAKQVELHVNEISRWVRGVATAADKLKAHPDDGEANTVVGKYWCFFRGNWELGLPMLAKGLDRQLSDLAKEDLANPQDADGMMKVAEKWWNLPDSGQTPQRRSRERAGHWYEVGLPVLSDSQKTLAQQRMAAVKVH
ncbi:MAG TPA: hypothetical protein VIM11_12365 [Tepidisphaeraceae bacterium]